MAADRRERMTRKSGKLALVQEVFVIQCRQRNLVLFERRREKVLLAGNPDEPTGHVGQ